METIDNFVKSVVFELVPATLEKYDTYYRFRSDIGDIYWTGFLTAPDYNKMKKLYLTRCSDTDIGMVGSEKLYFLHVHTDRMDEDVGYVLLYNKNDGFEFAYSVLGEYRCKGFGTKACELGTKTALILIPNKKYKNRGRRAIIKTGDDYRHEIPVQGRRHPGNSSS